MSAKTTRIGVGWIKQAQDGKKFLSVIITNPVGQDFRYTIWPVEEKRGENSPDYTVTKSADQPAAGTATQARAFAAARPDEFPSDAAETSAGADDDNVPF
jgi:uncharacterized protein (DUF736 family)